MSKSHSPVLPNRPAAQTFAKPPSLEALGQFSTAQWSAALSGVGYHPSDPVILAVRSMFRRRADPRVTGAQAVLLEGPPGVGKTYLGESVARLTQARMKVYQFHAWTDASELFVGVNVQAAVAGDAAHVAEPGVLAQVAVATTGGAERLTPFASGEPPMSGAQPVVLILDEIDKAPERVEALLLDYLQSGRVPIAPGRHLYTDLRQVLVFVTSNDMRPLTEAFLRRVRRVEVPALPVQVQVEVLAGRLGVPLAAPAALLPPILVAAAQAGAILSLQESANCLMELLDLDLSPDSPGYASAVRLILRGWVYRESPDDATLDKLTERMVEALQVARAALASDPDLGQPVVSDSDSSRPTRRNPATRPRL